MKKFDLGIAGGCASGLVAAVNAKRLYPELNIAIFEKLPRLGKKILSTGNGRCNMTNVNALSHEYKNNKFASFALNRYSPEKVVDFFASMGLLTYTDECGRVYPRSNNASSVLDALRYEIEKLGIECILEYPVTDIKSTTDGFIFGKDYCCKKLIIATGGKSSSPQGSDGSGFALAKSLGHKITALYPSLVPLNSRPEVVRSLKGVRATNVRLTLVCDCDEKTTQGEILFTETGVSGIAAMELGAFAEQSLRTVYKPVLSIDFLPEYSRKQLKNYISDLIDIKSGQPAEQLLTGILPKQIGISVLKAADIYYGGAVIEEMSDSMIDAVVDNIKSFEIEITGTRGFLNSQVTSGGVKVSEIDPETMKSKLNDNLWFCGEVIDVDGGCGGFNLQWAFASGLLAGELK